MIKVAYTRLKRVETWRLYWSEPGCKAHFFLSVYVSIYLFTYIDIYLFSNHMASNFSKIYFLNAILWLTLSKIYPMSVWKGPPPIKHTALSFSSEALVMGQVAWRTTKSPKCRGCEVEQCGPLSHLLVCLEDVLCGDRAHSCAQRFDHSICHLRAHSGGIGVQDTQVALVTLHHQLQRAPLGVHAADVYCTLLTPPAPTCRHQIKQSS